MPESAVEVEALIVATVAGSVEGQERLVGSWRIEDVADLVGDLLLLEVPGFQIGCDCFAEIEHAAWQWLVAAVAAAAVEDTQPKRDYSAKPSQQPS